MRDESSERVDHESTNNNVSDLYRFMNNNDDNTDKSRIEQDMAKLTAKYDDVE